MLSLNIFLPASIQFGIFIRLSLNFEHCVQRLDTQSTTGVLGWCHAVPFWTPTIKGTIRAYFTQVKKKEKQNGGLTEQMFHITLVGPARIVEKAPFSTHKVEGVHQVGTTQMLEGDRRPPWRAEHQQ